MCITNTRGSVCVKRTVVYVIDCWISPAMTSGSTISKDFSLAPCERSVDVAPMDFLPAREPSVRPQVEDQSMNPDDKRVASRLQTQPTRKEIQEHVLSHLPPRSWCGYYLRGRGTSLPHFRSKTEGACCADCVNRPLLHGSIWTRGSTRCAPDVGSEIS